MGGHLTNVSSNKNNELGPWAAQKKPRKELQVPFFHHEVVKQALVLTIEEPAVAEKLASLLGSLSKTGQLSPVQIQTGFARVRERLEGLKLDVPQAEQRFVECEQKAREVGWLV